MFPRCVPLYFDRQACVFVWLSRCDVSTSSSFASRLLIVSCVVLDQQVLSWGIMDLVDANDGSGESDPHNSGAAESSSLNGGRSSGGGNIGGSNPSHSQSSSAISIVHVSVPQAQVSRRIYFGRFLVGYRVFVCYLSNLRCLSMLYFFISRCNRWYSQRPSFRVRLVYKPPPYQKAT